MSRYEYAHASTLIRAGFYFSESKECENSNYLNMTHNYDYIPMYLSTPMKGLSPVVLFQRLNPSPPACLLESLSGQENGRYSIIASHPLEMLKASPASWQLELKPWLNLKVPELGLPFFHGGMLGYWTYESSFLYLDLPVNEGMQSDSFFFLPGEILIYDHYQEILTIVLWRSSQQVNYQTYAEDGQRLRLLSELAQSCLTGENKPMQPLTKAVCHDLGANHSLPEYCRMVEKAKERIRQGDILQVVLSRYWKMVSQVQPWQVYKQLRRINPSPYMFYLLLPDFILMGASPEMMTKVEKGKVKTRPLAGTRRLTGKADMDEALALDLLEDDKERAEHLMLVDLARNDIGKVAKTGSVKVSQFMEIERYSHVMHLVSTVEGELKDGVDALEAFQASFPAGTLTGAPKRKAMEIIREIEGEERQTYGGAVGYIGFDGNLDSCITIRSIAYQYGTYLLQSGAGIVADSIPENEAQETINKATVLMLAVKEAELADDSDG